MAILFGPGIVVTNGGLEQLDYYMICFMSYSVNNLGRLCTPNLIVHFLRRLLHNLFCAIIIRGWQCASCI